MNWRAQRRWLPKFTIIFFMVYALVVAARVNSFDEKGVYTVAVWSPDSRHAIYQFENDRDEKSLWLIREDGSTARLHPDFTGSVELRQGISWADENTIWLLSSRFDLSQIPLRIKNTLFSLDIAMSSITPILEFEGEWLGFSINPVTQELVFSELQDDFAILKTYDSATKTATALMPDLQYAAGNPLWSPDGKRLAFVTGEGIGIYQPENEVIMLDVPASGGANRMAWSPDSTALLFVGNYAAPGIYLVDMDKQQFVKSIIEGNFSYVSWSPDGKKVACTTTGVPGQNSLHIVDAASLGLENFISK